MKLYSKLTFINIICLFVIIFVIIFTIYFIKNTLHINILELVDLQVIEGFSSSILQQNGNIIYNYNGNMDNGSNISKSSNTINDIYTINLDKRYKITDIYLDILSTNKTNGNIQLGVFNSSKSEINFVNLNKLSLNINDKISKVLKSELIENNVLDSYTNDLYGNQLIIYLDKNIVLNKDSTIIICGISNDENINENEMEYLVDKSKEITGIISNTKISLFNNNVNNKLHKITQIEILNSAFKNKKEIRLDILYTNPYTNETLTYKSDTNDGMFIVTKKMNKILIYDNTLLVNNIELKESTITPETTDTPASTKFSNILNTNVIVKGYYANVNDINQFKLQNSITDIRGSINPNDVCPSIDNLLQGQLNAETIIDAMDYQEKIKDEKIKLQSRKEALLTLLEQKKDITRLGSMLDEIDIITEKRNKETDALNAIKLTKQMNEVSKLKEVLDSRIELNKKNTHNIDKVLLNIYREPTNEELLLKSENDTNINNIDDNVEISNDSFTDYKLPIHENMKI